MDILQLRGVALMATPNMLQRALAYARLGFSVFPAHTPIFNDAGECVGCTCEEWKRKQSQYGPDYVCPQPGKCPRVRWSEKSTTDFEQIKKWWSWWPDANIGIDAGKSGLLLIDADTYKEKYAGGGLDLDDNTVVTLTGNGGRHNWYRQPEGKQYGNATGNLPDGIDVRGHGGYVIAPGSLHYSGRRYHFLDGHSLSQIEIAPLPQVLVEALESAQARLNGPKVTLPDGPVPLPNLEHLQLSGDVWELIQNGAPKGKRSEADQTVITALIYAGATDDEILGVFTHFAIGDKFRERGRKYLAHSIANARRWVEDHPREQSEPEILEQLMALRAWVQSAEFTTLLIDSGIARPAEYEKTMIAIVNYAISRRARRVRLGSHQLGRMTNNSHMTAKRHLAMFGEGITTNHKDGTTTHRPGLKLVTVTDDPEGYGKWVDLSDLLRTVNPINLSPIVREVNSSQQFTDNHLDDEAFVMYPRHLAVKMRPDAVILPYGLSAAALLVAAVLFEYGELTRSAICVLTGLSQYTVGKMLRRMDEMGLLVVWQGKPYRYELHPNFEEVLGELRPLLPSYEITKRREWVRAEASITFVNRQLNAPEAPEPRQEAKLLAKRDRAEARKVELAEAAATNGVDITIKLAEHRESKEIVAHRAHLERLKTIYRHGERAEQRPKRRGYKPKRANASVFGAEIEWGELNAWGAMNYGPGWWLRRDINGILAAYERYLVDQDFVPTIHWDGPETAPVAA